MQRLAITQRLEKTATETRACLDVNWPAFAEAFGAVVVPVPVGGSVAAWWQANAPFDGVILTGGGDVAAVSSDPLSMARDALEREVVRLAGDLPVLGVCRGAQFLAVEDGGTLTELPGHIGTTHALSVRPGSRWFGAHHGSVVNSFHRWNLGGTRTLAVVATAQGANEAFEHPTRRQAGLVWHPERSAPFAPNDLALFARFFAASP